MGGRAVFRLMHSRNPSARTDHLVRGHLSPAARRGGMGGLKSGEEFGFVVGIEESLHGGREALTGFGKSRSHTSVPKRGRLEMNQCIAKRCPDTNRDYRSRLPSTPTYFLSRVHPKDRELVSCPWGGRDARPTAAETAGPTTLRRRAIRFCRRGSAAAQRCCRLCRTPRRS
jgi:hypothetical protein